MKTESNVRPTQKVLISDGNPHFVEFNDLDSIVEETRILEDGTEETVYVYQTYQVRLSGDPQKILEKADELYNEAKLFEFNDLAERIREKRNKLLSDSDKQMTLDRLGLDTSSAIKFLASLKNIFSGKWAKYRQALRDITDQPGFPYDVTFPDIPED